MAVWYSYISFITLLLDSFDCVLFLRLFFMDHTVRLLLMSITYHPLYGLIQGMGLDALVAIDVIQSRHLKLDVEQIEEALQNTLVFIKNDGLFC